VRGDDDLASASLTRLVALALEHDEAAWSALVDRVHRVAWKAINLVTGDPDIRDDAFASTMLRLAEHLGAIREPEKLPGWLAVTASREAIALSIADRRRVSRTIPFDDPVDGESPDEAPDHLVERRDAVSIVRRALATLDSTCRELLTLLLLTDPPLRYAEISDHFGRPHGWVGPTRERCVDKLRRNPTVASLLEPRPA
jgi:RNA polymerase sigma factor (sigma-70 family)